MNGKRIILLDGRTLTHEAIAAALEFPPYYGGNLDALHDCLTEIGQETVIIAAHAAEADARMLRVMRAAARENGQLSLYEG